MSKLNSLGLVANYGDSEEESDDGLVRSSRVHDGYGSSAQYFNSNTIAPLTVRDEVESSVQPECLWMACFDEKSGFTYYWNQYTNAVTWEAPAEYLLSLRLSEQQSHSSVSTEVSAEEWQMYQQALAAKEESEKVAVAKPPARKVEVKPQTSTHRQISRKGRKRLISEEEDEKIELITSYHNSDSESNDESNKAPVKSEKKKPKGKTKTVEYGPSLPTNQNYSAPIGPELPPELVQNTMSNSKENLDLKDGKYSETDFTQDEDTLFRTLKSKAKILKKLGGELSTEIENLIEDGTKSFLKKEKDIDIDDLLEDVEKKELLLVKCQEKPADVIVDRESESPSGIMTPPLDELKTLYPDAYFNDKSKGLFPSAANINLAATDTKQLTNPATPPGPATEKVKKENVYLPEAHEIVGSVNKKKLRISNSILPERKQIETPAYTTKYSQFIEGFSTERTGLGFIKDEKDEDDQKTTKYSNGLTFTKGETINENKKDDHLDDLLDLVEAKLKYLNELQPYLLTTLQEMFIQLQVVMAARRAGALAADWAAGWAKRAHCALESHEAAAAPPGWITLFQRSEGRYSYRRESDGLVQWEYPATTNTDMEICTTPPPQEVEVKASVCAEEPTSTWASSNTSTWSRETPPPPGTETSAPSPSAVTVPKKEIGDELTSFYNDIATLEKDSSPQPVAATPEPPPPPRITSPSPPDGALQPEVKNKDTKVNKKKPKMKVSASLGIKNKSLSSLVAKWQQVADGIDSD